MSININTATLAGRIGKDVETRYLTNGNAVSNFTMATNRSWKNRDTNEWEQESTWHNIVCYGHAAEKAAKHGSKGAEVAVIGRINNRKYQDKDGQTKYISEVIANDIQFPNVEKSDQGSYDGGYTPKGRNTYAEQSGGRAADPYNDPNTDIPF